MEDRRRVLEPVVAPLAAGLVVLVTLLGLIGTAIRARMTSRSDWSVRPPRFSR